MKIPFILVVLLLFTWGFSETSVSLSESSGLQGEVRLVPILLETDDAVVALQMDLSVELEKATLAMPELGSELQSTHELDFEILDGGFVKLVVDSASNANLVSGEIVDLPLTFSKKVAETDRSVSINNVFVAFRDGSIVNTKLIPFGRIRFPQQGRQYFTNELQEPIMIDAVAIDTDHFVSSVKFYINEMEVGISTTVPYSIHWQPTEEGDYVVFAAIVDLDGNTVNTEPCAFSVEIPKEYSSWVKSVYGEEEIDPERIDPFADPNQNGIPNIISFALGSDPRESVVPAPKLGSIFINGIEYPTFSYSRPRGLIGFDQKVLITTDFENWNGGPDYTEVTMEPDGFFDRVTVRSLISSDTAPVFFKFSVEVNQ